MIESIRGSVERTAESAIMIRTGPVVISVLAPGYFLRGVSPGMHLEIPVYLHLQMEGNRVVPLLVGFPDERDREFFEKFISVSGVGVRAAVKALEQPPDRIAAAIASEDCDYLTTLPGIGSKRARQIIAGLQEQMRNMYGEAGTAGTVTGPRTEARAVLRQLGVPLGEADRLIDQACGQLEENAGTAEVVKRAMRIRSGN
jgi:Holliday junction DNA helicase RuvA